MVSVVFVITDRLCPLFNAHSSCRSEKGADVDRHIEDGKGRIALAGIFRTVVKIADHYLQVAFEETRTKTDEDQGCEHSNHCYGAAT